MNEIEKNLSWAEISSEAINDLEFRQLLIDNPRQAIETKFNITLPKDVNYIVHEQSTETVHLVLPPLQSSVDPQRIGDDDEEIDPQRIGDDDEETDPQRIGDDDEEIDPQRIGDDDEESDPQRIGDDDEESDVDGNSTVET